MRFLVLLQLFVLGHGIFGLWEDDNQEKSDEVQNEDDSTTTTTTGKPKRTDKCMLEKKDVWWGFSYLSPGLQLVGTGLVKSSLELGSLVAQVLKMTAKGVAHLYKIVIGWFTKKSGKGSTQ